MPSSVRAGACAPCLPAPAIFLDLFKKAAGLSCSAELRKYSVPRGDGGCTVRISVGFLLWTSRCLWKQGDKNKGWNWTIHSRELHEAPWPCLQTRCSYCSWQLTYSFSSSSVHAPHAHSTASLNVTSRLWSSAFFMVLISLHQLPQLSKYWPSISWTSGSDHFLTSDNSRSCALSLSAVSLRALEINIEEYSRTEITPIRLKAPVVWMGN